MVWASGALSHLDLWGTAVVAAVSLVLVNNLQTASPLAACTPGHRFALPIGLNLGPGVFVNGSLAWLPWLRAHGMPGRSRPSPGPAASAPQQSAVHGRRPHHARPHRYLLKVQTEPATAGASPSAPPHP